MDEYQYDLGEYERGFEHGFRAGRGDILDLLEDALGEATHLADQIDVLRKQLGLVTTDDLE